MKSIMIVDDSSLMVDVFVKMMAEDFPEIEVHKAYSGEEAIEAYSKFRPGLVFMDLVMGGIDGFEASKRLLSMDRDAKIIMCTIVADPVKQQQAISAGCIGYLNKPLKKEDIIRAIKENFRR